MGLIAVGRIGGPVKRIGSRCQASLVAHEVTNIGNDRSQLTKMAFAAREAMDKRRLQALADRGYFNGPEIKACTAAGVTPLVPRR